MTNDGGYGAKGAPRFNTGGLPDTAVDYEIVARFAAMVGNRMVGTKAEKDALSTSLTAEKQRWEGLEFWQTDGTAAEPAGRYVYFGGQFLRNGLTPGTFTPAALYGPHASWDPLALERVTGRAHLFGVITNPSGTIAFTAGTEYQIGTVPAGFRPAKQVFRSAGATPLAIGSAWIVVRPNGQVAMAMQNGSSNAQNSWLLGVDIEWEIAA